MKIGKQIHPDRLRMKKEDFFQLLDGMAEILRGPTGGRLDKVKELTKRFHTEDCKPGYADAYQWIRGGSPSYRPWTEEWRRKANGIAEGLPPLVHIVGKPVSKELARYARELRDRGSSYAYISSRTGIPTGSLTSILSGQRVKRRKEQDAQPSAPAATTTPEPKKRSHKKKPAEMDLGADFRAFIEAKEEETLNALRVRHEQEREALAAKQAAEEKTTTTELAERRKLAITRLVDFYTTPGIND